MPLPAFVGMLPRCGEKAKRYQILNDVPALKDGNGEQVRNACMRIWEDMKKGSFYGAPIDEITKEIAREMMTGKDLESAIISVSAAQLSKAYGDGGVSEVSSIILGRSNNQGSVEKIDIVSTEEDDSQGVISIGGFRLPVRRTSDDPAGDSQEKGGTTTSLDGGISSHAELPVEETPVYKPADQKEIQHCSDILKNESSDPSNERDDMVEICGVMMRRRKMMHVLKYFS